MRRIALYTLALAGIMLATSPAHAGLFDKTGQAGMTFLKIGPVARAAAMADAHTGLSMGATSAFYNPAGLGYLGGTFDALATNVNWFADIKMQAASVAMPVRIGGDRAFVAALSYVAMDYGTIHGTAVNRDDLNGFSNIGNIDPTETVFGLSVAKQFTDKFSIGITAKYMNQTLPWYDTGGDDHLGDTYDADGYLTSTIVTNTESSIKTFVYDAGTMYRTGFGSSVISMSIRNFARTQTYELEGFRPPVTFSIGLTMDAFDLAPALQDAGHSLLVAIDGLHPPDHPEKVAYGVEYGYGDIVFLRAGYGGNYDTRALSLGGGVNFTWSGVRAGIDYAQSDFGESLGTVNYVTLKFGM